MIALERQETRRGIGLKNNIEALKAAVPIIDVADFYCGPGGLKRSGPDRWRGRCRIPDHEDDSPSFVVYAEQNTWHCFGCGRGKDVIDLEMLAGGHTAMWTAMVELSRRYGVELPGRSERWYQRQREKAAVLDAADEARKKVFRRRSFKVLVLQYIENIENPEERRQEIAAAWADWQESLRRLGR